MQHVKAHFEFMGSNAIKTYICWPLCCITSSFRNTACVWELRRLVPVVKSSAGVSSGLQGGHFLFTWTLLPLCCNTCGYLAKIRKFSWTRCQYSRTLSVLMATSKMCELSVPSALMPHIQSPMLVFDLCADMLDDPSRRDGFVRKIPAD